MKTKTKWIVTLAAVLTLGIAAANSVSARGYGPGNGNWTGSGCNNGPCVNAAGPVDEKTLEARENFYNETLAQRKEILTKRAELQALMSQDNPDAKEIGVLTGELFDLQNALRDKAKEAGITQAGYGCDGPGFGGGSGPRGRMWN